MGLVQAAQAKGAKGATEKIRHIYAGGVNSMPFLKQMEIVTDIDKLKVDIQETIMKYQTIKYWAYIIHDKDDTRPHYHIYLNFGGSSLDTKTVAEWFQLGENFISKVKGRKSDMYKYLTHSNDSQKFKHQYGWNEVIANFNIQEEAVKDDIVGHFEKFSYAQQIKYVSTLPPDSRASVVTKLDRLWKLRCKELSLQTDRNMKVVFVYGRSGTGKTYYSKKLLDSFGYDYCISSSSNDIFQDYLGQKAMILDDMRDTTFRFYDLLKILDNNTKSSCYSRFANKPIDCEMIIITSSIPLRFWYKDLRYAGEEESLFQLYRRISSYVDVSEKEISVYNELDTTGFPIGQPVKYVNEVFELKKQKKENKFNLSEIFDKFCTRMPEAVKSQRQLTEVISFDDILFDK